MNDDFKDPKVLGGLLLALTVVGVTITIIVIERF